MINGLIEKSLGSVDWQGSEWGYCSCPGKDLHTAKNGRRDCRVYVGPPVSVFCFHAQCKSILDKINDDLRREVREQTGELKFTPREQRPPLRERVSPGAKELLSRILSDERWDVEGNVWRNARPDDRDWIIWLGLWKSDDILWNGSPLDSGDEKHAKYFRTAKQFLSEGPLGPYVTGSNYKPGSFSRSNENAIPKYLIIESDRLSKGETLRLFSWLKKFLELRMIVDTGGKSIHGWFDWPAQDVLEGLKLLAPSLLIDHQTMKPSQPVRLPGVKRGDNWQRIYWIE